MAPEGFRLTEDVTRPPRGDLLLMAVGFRTTQALYVVAKLGVADVLERGPATADSIAAEVGAHPRSLFRVMRSLAALGVFTQDASDRFGLTPLGDPLRTHSPASLRHFLLFIGDEQYRAAGELLHTVRTGETAYNHVYGMGHFERLGRDPEAAATFNAAMAEGARRYGDPFTSLELDGQRLAVDVGGGRGELLAMLLRDRPAMRGVLYDLPQGVAEAAPFLASQGLADRVRIETGSMFDAVPEGGDLYLLSRILHDWPDDKAALILRNCRASIADDGLLLIREGIVAPGDAPSQAKQTDLTMLFMLGGAERTEAEWRALLEGAGFALERVHPPTGPFSLIAAKPV